MFIAQGNLTLKCPASGNPFITAIKNKWYGTVGSPLSADYDLQVLSCSPDAVNLVDIDPDNIQKCNHIEIAPPHVLSDNNSTPLEYCPSCPSITTAPSFSGKKLNEAVQEAINKMEIKDPTTGRMFCQESECPGA